MNVRMLPAVVAADLCADLDGALPRHHTSLPHRFFNLRDPIGTLQHFAGLGAVSGAYDTVALHEVDEVGGAAIADTQAALQEGSGRLAELDYQAHGIVVEGIVVVGGNFSR